MSTKDLLVELGTEELPPTALKSLALAFKEGIEAGLKAHSLSHGEVKWFATPRRLAVLIEALEEQAADQDIEALGPPVDKAKDEQGKWTKAAEGFARKHGVSPDQLTSSDSPKGPRLSYKATAKGAAVKDCLPELVEQSLNQLPIPKRMRWGASRSEFIRPVHWLVILFGADIIPAEILGVTSNNLSRGHRFHCDTWLPIANPGNYEKLLAESGHVIADFNKRQQMILQQVTEQGEKLGGETVVSEDLLEEVTGLVEWPVALAGSFDDDFLAVPPEALISSMKEHQKYFHVVDNTGKLLPNFITVANISSEDPAQVIQGNERVIRPRLSDAAFFYETDKKVRLDSRIEKLHSIVFQAKLGTLYEKTQRVKKLAGFIAGLIGGNVDYAERAAELSKADLISDMVLEFDKMQGVAGCYYALNDGEAIEVAHALKDQYLPKFSGDALPESLTACALALADRLDTLVGLFGIGQPPTGSKDPFALRRASLSILRILIEKDFNLEILPLIEAAASQYDNLPQASTVVNVVQEYIKDRFENMVVEQGVSVESFRATINTPGHSFNAPLSAHQRAHRVQVFSQTEAAKDLAEAAKRTRNILAKNPSDQVTIEASAFIQSAEKELATAIEKAQQEIASPDINLQLKLEALAKLQQPVSTFFDEVMVIADNETTRNNRLAQLKALNSLFLSVIDISYLALSR